MHLRSGKSLPDFENYKTRKKMVRPSTSLNINQPIPEGQPSQPSGSNANIGSGNGSTTLNQNLNTIGSSGPSVVLEQIGATAAEYDNCSFDFVTICAIRWRKPFTANEW